MINKSIHLNKPGTKYFGNGGQPSEARFRQDKIIHVHILEDKK